METATEPITLTPDHIVEATEMVPLEEKKPKKKNKGGRPPKFTGVDILKIGLLSYETFCIESRQLPNKAGLCVHLSIHKDTYNEYKKKPEYSDSIKAFEAYVENAWVQRLNSTAPTGAIFYLKNAFKEDYKDKHEVAIGGLEPADLIEYK